MPLACLLVTIYISLLFRRKQRLRTSTSTAFLFMTIFGIVHILFAVITEYTVNNRETVSPVINFIAHVIFLISITAILMMVLIYSVRCIEKACLRSLRPIIMVIFIVSIAFMLAEAATPIDYVDSEFGSYSLGAKAYCLYGFCAFFFALSTLLLVRFRKELHNEKRGALFTANLVIIVIGAIQIFFPFILLSGLGATVIILNFMIMIEDTRTYVSPDTTLYNKDGCNELIKEMLVEDKKFRLGVYAFSGNPERITLAMLAVQKTLPEKKSHCVCCTLGDNLLVIVPMRKFFYGHYDLPEDLPEHKPVNERYSCVLQIMEFGDEHSLSKVMEKIFTVRDRFNDRVHQQDELTETMGRAFFTQYTEQLISESQDFSFLMMDLDNFKNINDTYGHTIGDEVLKETANVLRATLRNSDCICRIGGDEFAIILSEVTDTMQLLDITARIRENLNSMKLNGRTQFPVCCSIGICINNSQRRCESFHEIYAAADRAMYNAKHNGKNRMMFAGDIPPADNN